MRKLAVILAVITLLSAPCAATAANLEAGWYVKLGGVGLFGYTFEGPFVIDWAFTSPMGTTGPFTVTQPDPYWPQRMISVATASSGVMPGIGVILLGSPTAPIPQNGTIISMDFSYQTYYDASQMRLELFVTHSDGSTELAYSETRSGLITTVGSAGLSPGDTFEFRVMAVPEPSTLMALSFPLLAMAAFGRRRTR